MAWIGCCRRVSHVQLMRILPPPFALTSPYAQHAPNHPSMAKRQTRINVSPAVLNSILLSACPACAPLLRCPHNNNNTNNTSSAICVPHLQRPCQRALLDTRHLVAHGQQGVGHKQHALLVALAEAALGQSILVLQAGSMTWETGEQMRRGSNNTCMGPDPRWCECWCAGGEVHV